MTRRTAVFYNSLCEGHAPPAHSEVADRVRVIEQRLQSEFPQLLRVTDSPLASREQLLLFHTEEHVDTMFRIFDKVDKLAERQPGQALYEIDEDTVVTTGTRDAALAAAGAVIHAIDNVMKSSDNNSESGATENGANESREDGVANAFCCVRPPGHHAEPSRAMGFCIFNNVGIGALHLLQTYPHEIKRVLVVDFDVHHGNGTQAKFMTAAHPNVKYISTHQSPFFPMTGKRHERGPSNNILNVPLVEGMRSTGYRRLFEARVVPAMEEFRPDFVLISAGFDAHELDPLAGVRLQHDDFYWMTKHIAQVALKFARGRIVSVLEGGYNLSALPLSAAAHVRALVEACESPAFADQKPDIDALSAAFASSVRVATGSPPPDLRVTVHLDAREKLLVVRGERSLEALEAQCRRAFNSRQKRSARALHDRHGARLTPEALQSLPSDQHLYLR